MLGSPFRELATVQRSYRGVKIVSVSATQTDQDLWDLAVAGESIAFGELFERHHKAVYNYCFRRTSSWDMAEDLTCQVFLETWRGRQGTALAIDSLLPWLLGVASRLTSHEWRTRVRRGARDRRLPAPEMTPDPADDVAGRIDDERRMARVLDAIHHLPRADQDVLSLCVFAELDYESAAIALDIPIGTLRSRLSRARNRLRLTTVYDIELEEEGKGDQS